MIEAMVLKAPFPQDVLKKIRDALLKKDEADSISSAAPGLLVAKPKDVKPGEPAGILAKEGAIERAHFVERSPVPDEKKSIANPSPKPSADIVGPTVFDVVLIEEGLGNFGSAYFYTKECLAKVAPLFEGKKIYADHPSESEDKDRPERSVRDIVGHFEECRFEINEESKQGYIRAKAVMMPDEAFRWARALMRHAVDYSRKFPEKNFIGLSINAGGNASPVGLDEFVNANSELPKQVLMKLAEAKTEGIETIQIVSDLSQVTSCDIVTEAGAGGKILQILEGNKQMSVEKKQENEKKENEGEKQPPAADAGKSPVVDGQPPEGKEAEPGHDDEEQDKALIMDMLKKVFGDKLPDGAEQMAQEAYEAYKGMGHSKEKCHEKCEAYMEMAKHQASKKESENAEKKEDEAKAKESAKKSAELEKENLRLKGEIARFKESEAKRELEGHIDSVLSKSGLKREITKTFKESGSVKAAKTKAEFDKCFEIFMEGYKASGQGSESRASLDDLVISTEKRVSAKESSKGGETVSLDGCVL